MKQSPSRPTLLALLVLIGLLGSTQAQQPSAHKVITAGCTEVGGGFSISRTKCSNPELEPLLWGSPRSTGGDKYGLQGTLPSPSFAGHFGSGRVMVWTAHEGFWGNGKDAAADNPLFRSNAIGWLLGETKRVALATGHSEMLNINKLSSTLRNWMDMQGITLTEIDGALSYDNLNETDLLIVGNTWGDFPEVEAAKVADWVHSGGAVLAIGLGWAYYQYNDDASGESYAINRLGKHFGWHSLAGTISDPSAPNGQPGKPSFTVLPLSEYTPGEVVVLPSESLGLSEIPQLAQDHPHNIYVAVGKYMGLQFPADAWAKVDDPAAAVELMDRVYSLQEDLIGWANRPFGGSNIWYISKDDPDGRYYMHSGNPIVMKVGAARDTARVINDEGRSGWGTAHELGHNMVISACGNLFVHSGTGEEWCNVFTTWTFLQMGWPKREGAFDEGHKYHRESDPDFAHMTSNPWVLLGCLELIWNKYGWDGMQTFLTKAATDTANGVRNKGNEERTAYWVENLSQAYEIDFADLIAHWGFPVTPASREITAQYEPADIPW